MLKIAFVSSEIAPYASTGGLADVCGFLPGAMKELGVDVTLFMPMYRGVIEGAHAIEDTGIRLSIPVGFHRYQADIWRKRGNKHPAIYFIRRDEFFDRSQLYGLPERDYDDNFERFIFFQKAVTALINHLGSPFDIVHAHDWQTALMPLYLHYGMSGEGRAAREKVVFTIHNLGFQGIFGGDYYSYTNLPFSCFSVDFLEYYGNVNCLKGGITSADMVTTASATYAKEIQTEAWGLGLHGVLRDASRKLRGIENGIDVDTWNPATDAVIASRFDHADLSGKMRCKEDLIRRVKLKIRKTDPLLGMVTRLTDQKGIGLIGESLPAIMDNSTAGFVMLGSGTEEMLKVISGWAERWPGRVVAKTGIDEKLARRIIAGADIYLMPSQSEPCGFNQLYSLRYGTIPVVHRVGGLADTIVDCVGNPGTGFGFTFDRFTATVFIGVVDRAIKMFGQTATWTELQRRAMAVDSSWTRTARKYIALYQEVLGQQP